MVTGAGGGIGRATALALIDAGFAVGLVGRSRKQLEDTAAEIAERGGRSVVAIADVTSLDALDHAVADIETGLAGIDVLINNAGSMHAIGPAWEVRSLMMVVLDVQTSLWGGFCPPSQDHSRHDRAGPGQNRERHQ